MYVCALLGVYGLVRVVKATLSIICACMEWNHRSDTLCPTVRRQVMSVARILSPALLGSLEKRPGVNLVMV